MLLDLNVYGVCIWNSFLATTWQWTRQTLEEKKLLSYARKITFFIRKHTGLAKYQNVQKSIFILFYRFWNKGILRFAFWAHFRHFRPVCWSTTFREKVIMKMFQTNVSSLVETSFTRAVYAVEVIKHVPSFLAHNSRPTIQNDLFAYSMIITFFCERERLV